MNPSEETTLRLKNLYHAYRHTTELDRKSMYFSPTCMQICRPTPTYAATTRGQIVQYLRDAQQGKVPVNNSLGTQARPEVLNDGIIQKTSHANKSVYTIRPLLPSEYEFGAEDNITPIHMTSDALHRIVKDQQWVGMRVDLWDEGPVDTCLLVKVQYWWRLERAEDGKGLEGDTEGYGWRQCMHDIMYLGPREGTEHQSGLDVLE
jgi:hypothetical protein